MNTKAVMEVVKKARLRQKLTQVEVAQKIGVPQGNYSKWESGDSNMLMDTFFRILDALSLDIAFSDKEKASDDFGELR